MKNIHSEEPEIHWGFLDIDGKTILDLGCSPYYTSISTWEWFVNNGARKVIGIDLGNDEYSEDKFIYHVLNIDSSSKIIDLIKEYNPQIIKCDIEGSERNFKSIKKEDLGNVKEFAVEYHDNETKVLMEDKLKEWGFDIVDYYTLMGHDIERIGVIHAKSI